MFYLVQTGLLAEMHALRVIGPHRYTRDCKVVCRTERGLEIGTVVTEVEIGDQQPNGTILRQMNHDDQRIVERIERFKNRAFKACQDLIVQEGIVAVLVDVEHLFDGESVFFYFLGDVPQDIHRISDRLTEIYDKKIRFREFAEKLANGCGPGCGTTASKCSNGACSSCGLAGGCHSSKD